MHSQTRIQFVILSKYLNILYEKALQVFVSILIFLAFKHPTKLRVSHWHANFSLACEFSRRLSHNINFVRVA